MTKNFKIGKLVPLERNSVFVLLYLLEIQAMGFPLLTRCSNLTGHKISRSGRIIHGFFDFKDDIKYMDWHSVFLTN